MLHAGEVVAGFDLYPVFPVVALAAAFHNGDRIEVPEGCCPRFEAPPGRSSSPAGRLVLLPVGGVGHRFAGPVFYRDFEKGVAALGLVVRDVQLRPETPAAT